MPSARGADAVHPGQFDPVLLSYQVEFSDLGDDALNVAIERASLLAALRSDVPVPPFALIARADADRIRIDDVVRSFGYYDAVIDVQIDGLDLADPALPGMLAARGPGSEVSIVVQIDAGPLYRIAKVEVDGDVPTAARLAVDLRAGEPAAARPVLAGREALLDALREDGFALAQAPPPQATVDHRTRKMDVVYLVEPGPRASIGAIEISGLESLSDAFVRRRLGLRPGDRYSPSRLEQARQDLVASEAVASARVTPAEAVDADDRLPVLVDVVEAKRRAIRAAAAYASDDGASLALEWTHRNLLGRAERLSLRAEIGTIDGGSRDRMDYAAGASLRLPDRWRRDLDVVIDAAAVSESLRAYDRDAVTLGGALERCLSPRLCLSLGAAFERSRIEQDAQTSDYRLASLPLSLDWDVTDDALATRHGLRLGANLVPVPWVEGDGRRFTRVRLRALGYLDLGRLGGDGDETALANGGSAGNTIVAGRVALGRIFGAGSRDVPPDWRFYAGGADSVRGYPLQSIGPRTAGNAPAGGDASLEASIELRQRIGGPWGIVAFADAGSVSDQALLGLGGLSVGVGLGIRFHTIIGPLRADLAVPLDPYPGDPSMMIYLGLGEAF
jgi:translocation and assembly module TamA